MPSNAFARPITCWLIGLFLAGQWLVAATPLPAAAPIMEFTGPTMGTRYMVKVFDPPDLKGDRLKGDRLKGDRLKAEIQIEVDVLLRRINDQMSTYLATSELSRFNQFDSTDWFDVSPETASVVAFAQSVSEKTAGAFDVTVGPLVNAWSFGPDPRTRTVPDADTLATRRSYVGYQMLSVRTDPPALRKELPQLQVDLSAVAKGYAVDRVVELLNEAGAPDVFVEIGGEVRASGSKDGQWWKVGIQVPDLQKEAVLIAHSLNTGEGNDQAMATSGDYRNFFEVDGVRYSHTIDPRTGRPIDHNLASVSVLAESCMAADAWATALNVLGPKEGAETAARENLSALLIRRQGDTFLLQGTGMLAQYTVTDSTAVGSTAATAEQVVGEATGQHQSLAIAVITACAFAMILSAMAIGVMFGRRAISGSCGGLGNVRNGDGSVSCSLCSNPADACKELRKRMDQDSSKEGEQIGKG